ncbi:hypothetical protein VTL71DRAFT_9550 [Oculimacula yallundae]|uniref:Uncharacterized protein n=1 Tax=Oculimacula yallundae TaxID=86028 RepID=A0ABR4BR62_9HELO
MALFKVPPTFPTLLKSLRSAVVIRIATDRTL